MQQSKANRAASANNNRRKVATLPGKGGGKMIDEKNSWCVYASVQEYNEDKIEHKGIHSDSGESLEITPRNILSFSSETDLNLSLVNSVYRHITKRGEY